MSYEKIEQNMGIFWPCPAPEHPGTPRLFEGGKFFHPDGKARFHPIPFRESAEVVETLPLGAEATILALPATETDDGPRQVSDSRLRRRIQLRAQRRLCTGFLLGRRP